MIRAEQGRPPIVQLAEEVQCLLEPAECPVAQRQSVQGVQQELVVGSGHLPAAGVQEKPVPVCDAAVPLLLGW